MKTDLFAIEEEVTNSPNESFVVPMAGQEELEGDRLEINESNKITKMGREFSSNVMASGLQVLK
jgi:hypothetical protein